MEMFHQIQEEKLIQIEDGEKINIIRIDKDDDDDDVQRSSLLFEKAQGVDEESENNQDIDSEDED